MSVGTLKNGRKKKVLTLLQEEEWADYHSMIFVQRDTSTLERLKSLYTCPLAKAGLYGIPLFMQSIHELTPGF